MQNETRSQIDSQDKTFICTNSSNGHTFTIFKQNQHACLGQADDKLLEDHAFFCN